MTNWLCILNRENFETVKNKLVWGVSERHKKNLLKAKPKDLCAFYLITDGFEDRKKDSGIGGIFEVVSQPYLDRSEIFPSMRSSEDVYPYRIHLKHLKTFQPELPFKPLIPELKFITNKEHYSGHIMGRGMREMPESDMKSILKA